MRRLRFVCQVLMVLSTGACGIGRTSGDYRSFEASHDAIRPGMSIRQAFAAGLADYMIQLGSKNVPGSTLSAREPVSAECRRHVLDVHHGSDPEGFSVRVYCNMNGPSDRQVTPQGSFQTRGDLLEGLDKYSSWAASMSFRVESPPLKIGGVYDSYTFTTDEHGTITAVSPIQKSSE